MVVKSVIRHWAHKKAQARWDSTNHWRQETGQTVPGLVTFYDIR